MLEREYLLQMSKKDSYAGTCSSCDEMIQHSSLRFRMGTDGVLKCSKCATTDAALIKRSLVMSIVVGSMLTLINQGNVILSGASDASLAWKIPLTFAVPFAVSWTSVLSASQVSVPSDGGSRLD